MVKRRKHHNTKTAENKGSPSGGSKPSKINIYPFNEGETSRANDYSKLQKMKRCTLHEKTVKVKGKTVSMQNSGIYFFSSVPLSHMISRY